MTHAASIPRLRTVGEIARTLRVPPSRIAYIVSTRADIQPAATAGTLRLFDSAAEARIRHEVAAIAARRAQGGDQ